MLVDILDKHPDILCYGELLLDARTLFNTAIIPQRTLFNWLYSKVNGNFTEKTVGFKVQLEHLDDYNLDLADMYHALKKPRFIILYRLNMLDIYVSLEIARKTNLWLIRDARERLHTQINLDWSNYLEYRNWLMNHWLGLKKALHELGAEYMVVCYEDLVASRATELKKIENFLGVQEWGMYDVSLLKQNPTELPEKVSNYADIAHYLEDKTLIEFDVKKLFDHKEQTRC